ncbi:MAG: hypothetical protein R3C32_00825 [Chloroflexota bacterium]
MSWSPWGPSPWCSWATWMPDAIPAVVRGWAEGAVAILFVTAIVGMTGGVFSPFAAGYFLIVGAAGLSRDALATVTVAFVSAFAAAAVDLTVRPRAEGWSTSVMPAVAFLGVALVLLAATVATAGREHAPRTPPSDWLASTRSPGCG